MSAVPAQTRPAPDRRPGRRAGEQSAVPGLRPVPRSQRRRAPRLVYAISAIGGLVAIVIAQLLLSLALTEGAYEIDGYQMQQIKLEREQQKLREDLDRLESPQNIAQNAESIGMVPGTDPVYLQLSNGAVLGQPSAAEGGAQASGPLVPNSLIDGVPPVNELPQQQTPAQEPGTGPGGAEATGGGAAGSAEPPVADALPTPSTH
ncbi:hypothetical protein FLP10_01270 [Agromyces intestinalis]|uniref:Cell division protein FtsL n=1 Tax=Agromyces intestinalis TaxID=2592652 RepID=A0A5C1YCV2_9MICO|nr:hypothetical protein [Agromyces intestinalis]QEO13195.1 hypothetical protein FLP10_01270 [Agromyces intestinalis]